MVEKSEYGNWVSKRLIYETAAIGLIFLGLSILLRVLVVPGFLSFLASYWFLFLIPAGLSLCFSVYFMYARYQFAPRGGNVQNKVLELLLAHLDWNGKGRALDIGCGNGPLTIKLAQKYAEARIVGIDYWGGQWEYSRNICEANARIEGVSKRVTFQKASASALPFDDEYFDAVVSNLVFHEVKDTADKREVIREALRVVKKGGKFAFQDLFLMKRIYGDTKDLIKTIRSWGVTKVKFVETRGSTFIPRSLKLPFMLGTIGIITGEK
ncbi:MAG: class I SAM-dependent methyltransferase [Candidatus Freyarchaeum deiterrae]